jgi:putative oxidoreductase
MRVSLSFFHSPPRRAIRFAFHRGSYQHFAIPSPDRSSRRIAGNPEVVKVWPTIGPKSGGERSGLIEWPYVRVSTQGLRAMQLRFLEKLQPLALLLLRCGLALVFAFHGYPKLFGKTAVFVSAFERLGLPGYFVYIAGIIEVFGALMLMLGLYTPVAALLLLLDMCAAMWKYNFNEGVYAVREYELPLVLGLAVLALATTGAGAFSLDHLIMTFRRSK